MKISRYDVGDDVRMCRMIILISVLAYQDFFCPDVPLLQLGQAQQKIGDVNQDLTVPPYQVLFLVHSIEYLMGN